MDLSVEFDECELAFQQLKLHLSKPPILSTPMQGEPLLLYLAVSTGAVSAVLFREEQHAQKPVYYVSKRLVNAEFRYPDMEKLALALITSSRKLRPYFQSHIVKVLTNYPMRQILQKPETSGRILKWAVELNQFEIKYVPRAAIKG